MPPFAFSTFLHPAAWNFELQKPSWNRGLGGSSGMQERSPVSADCTELPLAQPWTLASGFLWSMISVELHLFRSFFEKKKKRLFIYFQREGEGGRNRGRETSMYERNINWLALACPLLGTWPATQACALTRNRTGDLSVCRLALSPLSHTSQGHLVRSFISLSSVFGV